MKQSKPNTQPLWRFLLFLYCLVMLWLLFGRSSGIVEGLSYGEQLHNNMNLKPFYTIGNYVHVVLHGSNGYLIRHCFINLLGNVLLFIPAGFLLPRIYKKLRNFIRFVFLCLAIMLLVEVLQLLTLLGSFDVDDLILNLFGMTLGYLLCILTSK